MTIFIIFCPFKEWQFFFIFSIQQKQITSMLFFKSNYFLWFGSNKALLIFLFTKAIFCLIPKNFGSEIGQELAVRFHKNLGFALFLFTSLVNTDLDRPE